MTKYKITNNGRLYEYIRKYKDYRPDPVFRNTVRESAKDKLFSNPVTSIAYSHEFPKTLGSDYDMDKKDIIKALDFWINDKVLQNEKMLALNGNLKDFEESELKDLISIKTYVAKLPNDTIFKRFNRTNNNDYNKLYSDTIEFYYPMTAAPLQEQRKHIPTISDSNTNLDGFEMMWHTPVHLTNALNSIAGAAHNAAEGMTNAFSRIGDDDFRDEVSIRMTGGRHSDNWQQAPSTNNPNTWTVVQRDDGMWSVRNPNGGTNIAVFHNVEFARAYIEHHKNMFNDLTASSTAVTVNDPNPNNWHVESDDSTGARRYKVVDQEGILIHIRTIDLTFASIPEAEQSMREHRQLYDRDRDQYYRSVLEREPPSNIHHVGTHTVPLGVSSITEDGILHVPDTPEARQALHRLEELLGTGSTANEEHNTTFENMYLTRQSITANSSGGHVDFYFDGMTNGAQMSFRISGENRFFPPSSIHDGPHTIELLYNNKILIDGSEYTVTEPIRVSYSRDEQPDRTDNDTFKEYTDMSVSIGGTTGGMNGDNSYIINDLYISGPLVDIELQIYVTGRQIDEISQSFRNHTVKVFDHDHSRIEIDGHRIYVTSMEVTYK